MFLVVAFHQRSAQSEMLRTDRKLHSRSQRADTLSQKVRVDRRSARRLTFGERNRKRQRGLWKFQIVEQLHAAFGRAAYSSKLSNTFTPRSVALRPLAGLVPVTTRPEVTE